MDETDRTTGEFTDEEEDARRSSVFAELKPYCVELLELLQNPTKHSSAIPALLQLFRSSRPSALQPFFDYSLFPLLLLLDAAVDCRSQQKDDTKENFMPDVQKMPHKEELLKKCHLRSVDQMVVVLKKLTYGALLSPFEASEEFRGGVIKCFRALLSCVLPCPDMCCACKQIHGLPTLLESSLKLLPLLLDIGRRFSKLQIQRLHKDIGVAQRSALKPLQPYVCLLLRITDEAFSMIF
nr:hypothetical protein CFP56_26259 [Quercus suber]